MNAKVSPSKRALTIGLSVGIAATLAVGSASAISRGGVAGVGGHGTGSSSPLAAERAYLAQLRPIAMRIGAAIAPAQHVLNEVALPKAGDAFAARDALAHGDSLAKLASARRALLRLKAPVELAADQHKMLVGTHTMETSLHQLHKLGHDESKTLMGKVTGFGAQLSLGESSWSAAIRDAYRTGHRKAPKLHAPKPAATNTAWIFGADRSCSAASFKLVNTAKYVHADTLSGFESYDALWKAGLMLVNKRIAALPRPKGSGALPTTLRSRLRVLKYDANIFSNQLAGLHADSFSTVSRTESQIHDVLPSLRTLGKDLRSYGAVSCGTIVSIWGGHHVSATPTVHHHGSLNT